MNVKEFQEQLNLSSGTGLNIIGEYYGVYRNEEGAAIEGDVSYRNRILSAWHRKKSTQPDRYEPSPGDHFAKEGHGVSNRVYRAISVGERMIFAEDIHESEETLCDKFATWVKVDDNGEMIRHARIMSVFHQVIDGDLPESAGAHRIRVFVREIEELAEQKAQREAQPTPEQAIAIGHRVHVAIENALVAIPRPHGSVLSEWLAVRGLFIKAAQAAFNDFEEKEQANDCPF